METKSLLFGLIGLFLGGLIVSLAVTFQPASTANMTMMEMTDGLRGLNGDEYDKAFIANMIDHHQSAVDMARLSADRAKHQEIKALSIEIINAQQKEIDEMRAWQKEWGYPESSSMHIQGGHGMH